MSYLDEYWQQAKTVVFSPEEFFAGKDDRDVYQDAIVFAIVSSVIFALLNATASRIMASAGIFMQPAQIPLLQQYIAALGTGALSGLIGPFIIGGIYHLIVLLFGRKGYAKTFQVIAYTTAVNAFFGWIPFINLLAWLYGLYVTYLGIRELHNFSKGKAVAVVLIPFVGFLLLFIALASAAAPMFV